MDVLQNRDVIVIGASAGGVDALGELVAGLPADLPAAVFIVIHLDATFASRLAEILGRRTALPVRQALHGEEIERGRIYVAPSDNHLMLRQGYTHVARGPKENGHRPAVDALFRSASTTYGSRVIGVVLTGYHDCGTAGLLSIKARGGVAVVQDPADALIADMPQSAIKHVAVDHVAALRDIPALLARLVQEPAPLRARAVPRNVMELEGDERGAPLDLVCPLCQGALTETRVNGFELIRCHVGHAFTPESIAEEQADAVERALWAAVRILDESAGLNRRFAERATGSLRDRFADKQEVLSNQARVIERLLLSDGMSRTQAGDVAALPPGGDHDSSP